jgi:hypothetical protein
VEVQLSNYLIFSYWKEQEIVKVALDDGAIVPSAFSCKEGESEPYMTFNTFSQLLMVIFQRIDQSSDDMHKEFNCFSFILQGPTTDDLIIEF